jgi:hypothetical protein
MVTFPRPRCISSISRRESEWIAKLSWPQVILNVWTKLFGSARVCWARSESSSARWL